MSSHQRLSNKSTTIWSYYCNHYYNHNMYHNYNNNSSFVGRRQLLSRSVVLVVVILSSFQFHTVSADILSEYNDDDNIQSIPPIKSFPIHRMVNTVTNENDGDTKETSSSDDDKYRTLKTSIAAFLITLGALGILGWIYLAVLRIKYNRELKREETLKKRMGFNASGVNPKDYNDEEHGGCGVCCNGSQSNGPISPFPIPIHPKDHDRVTSFSPSSPSSSPVKIVQETSFDGQFGVTSQQYQYQQQQQHQQQQQQRKPSPRNITPTAMIPEDDTDSFARALRNAAMQDEYKWNEMQTKKQHMMEQQQKQQQQGLRQPQPQPQEQKGSSLRQQNISPERKYAPQAFQSWSKNGLEYGDPGDIWLTSHSASTTGHSESESTSISSYAGKNSSVEEGDYNDDSDGFRVMKNGRYNGMSNRPLLSPIGKGEDDSSNSYDEESFGQAMSMASGTSTSLGIPSVSASAIDRDPIMHGFFVINEENDLMDQYIPQDEYEAAVHAAAMTLKNSPVSKHLMDRNSLDAEPLLLSSDPDTSHHLQPYKLTKSLHFSASDKDVTSPHRRERSPSSAKNSILNESVESSTTGGGTGVSTAESYESDPRKNKAIFNELKNVSVFLKTYEKKKSLKKKKNVGKFKLMKQGHAGSIPELDEQLDDLSVDTSTYDGSNLISLSLASLATTKSEGETSGETSSKFKKLYSFGRAKKGYISEKELKSMEVKIKPKGKKSRSAKRVALPPRHGNTPPRSETLSTKSKYPAIGTSPSGESAASERRFLTTEIESFFAQKGKGVYESIEVSPKQKSLKNDLPKVSLDNGINKLHSGSSDFDITDVMNDDNRASLAIDTRLGAAPFNPKESSPNMSQSFIEKYSSPRWKRVDMGATANTVWNEDSIEHSVPSPSHVRNSSPSNARNASPSHVRNSSPSNVRNSSPSNANSSSSRSIRNSSPRSIRNSSRTNFNNSVDNDRHVTRTQSPKESSSFQMNNIRTKFDTSPHSIHHTSPTSKPVTPSSIFPAIENVVFEDLPAPSSVRESALRARKDRELMGFPKRNKTIPSPPPPPPSAPSPTPLQHSPLAQSAKKMIETGAKSIASIVERTRNQTQSPKNAFPSSPNRLVPSSKDTTPIFAQTESTPNFESKIQSSARSLMSMFESKSVDGNKSTDGTSLSSDHKISDRISNRLNQIRQSVKERTVGGSGKNDVPAVIEKKEAISHPAQHQDNFWTLNEKINTRKEQPMTVFDEKKKKNTSTANTSSTKTNTLPDKIASLHSTLTSSNVVELSPTKRLRSPGKLLKQQPVASNTPGSPYSVPTGGQMNGDSSSPFKEESVIGKARKFSSHGVHQGHYNSTQYSANGTRSHARDEKNDHDASTPFSGKARDMISMFESKTTTNHGVFPKSDHWQYSNHPSQRNKF